MAAFFGFLAFLWTGCNITTAIHPRDLQTVINVFGQTFFLLSWACRHSRDLQRSRAHGELGLIRANVATRPRRFPLFHPREAGLRVGFARVFTSLSMGSKGGRFE